MLAAGVGLADQEAHARFDITPDALPKVCMTVDRALEKAAADPAPAPQDETDKRYRLHPALYEQLQTSLPAWSYLRLSFEAAKIYDLNPILFANQIFHESDRYSADVIRGDRLSRTGAVGISQIQPESAGNAYGMSDDDYRDPRRAIFFAARIKCDMKKKFRSDEILALVGYNGGIVGKKKGEPGPVEYAGNMLKIFTGEMTGDLWLTFNEKRHKERNNAKKYPGAWHNETLKYVKTITGTGWPDYMIARAERQQGEGYLASEADTAKFWASVYGDPSVSLLAYAFGKSSEEKPDPFAALLGVSAAKETAFRPAFALPTFVTAFVSAIPAAPAAAPE